jgi:20S proteasome subunit beta 2
MIASNLELHRMATKRSSRVVTALTMLKTHLFKYQGHVGAACVLGGHDKNGPHLFCVYPHGSSDALPFATMGSGSLAAMAVFEADFKEDMAEEEAKELGETASHTTPFAWCTPFLKDFSRRHSSPAFPFQRLTGKTFD